MPPVESYRGDSTPLETLSIAADLTTLETLQATQTDCLAAFEFQFISASGHIMPLFRLDQNSIVFKIDIATLKSQSDGVLGFNLRTRSTDNVWIISQRKYCLNFDYAWIEPLIFSCLNIPAAYQVNRLYWTPLAQTFKFYTDPSLTPNQFFITNYVGICLASEDVTVQPIDPVFNADYSNSEFFFSARMALAAPSGSPVAAESLLTSILVPSTSQSSPISFSYTNNRWETTQLGLKPVRIDEPAELLFLRATCVKMESQVMTSLGAGTEPTSHPVLQYKQSLRLRWTNCHTCPWKALIPEVKVEIQKNQGNWKKSPQETILQWFSVSTMSYCTIFDWFLSEVGSSLPIGPEHQHFARMN